MASKPSQRSPRVFQISHRPYWVAFKTQVLIVLQYRAQAWAGVFTQLIFGLLRVYMLVAMFAQSPNQPMSLAEGVTYIWFTQMLLTLIAWGPDPLMAAMIREGTLAYEMIRPVRLSLAWYMRSLAFRGAMPVMRGLPILLVASLLPAPLGIVWPKVTITWVASLLLALLVAWLLAGAFNNLINILVVVLMDDTGLVRLAPIAMFFFGGLILPMPLFPEQFQTVIQAMPFVGIMDLPASVFSGHLQGVDALSAIGYQSLWILVLLWLNDRVLEHRLKRAVVQGG